MSKRKKGRRRARQPAVEQAARRAAEILTRARRRGDLEELDFTRPVRVPGRQLLERLTRQPRQIALGSPIRKRVLITLERVNGRPIGRRTRQKLRLQLPEVLAETLCKRKRVRRAALFANRLTRKGSGAARRTNKKGAC